MLEAVSILSYHGGRYHSTRQEGESSDEFECRWLVQIEDMLSESGHGPCPAGTIMVVWRHQHPAPKFYAGSDGEMMRSTGTPYVDRWTRVYGAYSEAHARATLGF